MMGRHLATRVSVRYAGIRAAGYAIRGRYYGGAYIDLYFAGDRVPFDVINVWDYAANRARIPFTNAAVRAALIDWRDAAGESLASDLREYRYMMRAYGS